MQVYVRMYGVGYLHGIVVVPRFTQELKKDMLFMYNIFLYGWNTIIIICFI